MNVLFIDNFDSFTFNLVDDLERRGANVAVWRNDVATELAVEMAKALAEPRLVMLSPGPGAPVDAGCCVPLIRALADQDVPVVGVCLGHQAIVEAFGGEVGFAGEVVHGKTAQLDHDQSGPFKELPSPMAIARYHSLVAQRVPDPLRVTATTGDLVMAVTHRQARIFGVQFHPESILTPLGGRLMDGILDWATTT